MQKVKSSFFLQPHISPEMLSQTGQDTGACVQTFWIINNMEWKQRLGKKPKGEFINESWFFYTLWEIDLRYINCLLILYLSFFPALKIQCSSSAYELLEQIGEYVLVCRGNLQVKVRMQHLYSAFQRGEYESTLESLNFSPCSPLYLLVLCISQCFG